MTTYKTGDLILAGTPLAFALYSEERKNHCDFCFKTILSEFECSDCKYVKYCSLGCSKNGYNLHKDECTIFKKRPLHNLTRIIYRLIKVFENDPEKYDLVDGEKRKLTDLMDHLPEIKNDYEAMLTFHQIFDEIELIDNSLEINYVLKIYGQVLTNSFAIHDEKLTPIGRGVYLGASIFDHSCIPDASYTFIGTTIYIKATRELNVNSLREIYISYLNELDNKEDRITSLKAQYYFTCLCRRCRFQKTNETCKIVNENQLKSICELIDKLSIDFNTIIYRYIEKMKPIFNRKTIDIVNLIKEDLEEFNPDKIKLFNGLIELTRKLKKSNLRIIGPLTCKILDWLSYVDCDIKLSIEVIDYFRKYYGQTHIRLAQKLYLTALLIQEKDCRLKNQLFNESLKIAQIISPNINQIKQSRGRQINLNNSFLNEIEKQLYLSKNSIQIDRKIVESRPRFRSVSKSRLPLSSFRLSIYN